MIIIKNTEELKKLVNEHDDLIYPDEDIRIEFEPTKDEIRNVECRDLFMMNDESKFDFNGRDFNGLDFNGRDFNGGDFNGGDFNGGDFTAWDITAENITAKDITAWDITAWDITAGDITAGDITARNITGKEVSYYAFFNCYGSIKCESIEGRRNPHAEPVCLDGKIEFIKEEDDEIEKAIKLLEEKGKIKNGKIII